MLNGEAVGQVDIVAQNNVEKIGFVPMIKKVLSNWYKLLR